MKYKPEAYLSISLSIFSVWLSLSIASISSCFLVSRGKSPSLHSGIIKPTQVEGLKYFTIQKPNVILVNQGFVFNVLCKHWLFYRFGHSQ